MKKEDVKQTLKRMSLEFVLASLMMLLVVIGIYIAWTYLDYTGWSGNTDSFIDGSVIGVFSTYIALFITSLVLERIKKKNPTIKEILYNESKPELE